MDWRTLILRVVSFLLEPPPAPPAPPPPIGTLILRVVSLLIIFLLLVAGGFALFLGGLFVLFENYGVFWTLVVSETKAAYSWLSQLAVFAQVVIGILVVVASPLLILVILAILAIPALILAIPAMVGLVLLVGAGEILGPLIPLWWKVVRMGPFRRAKH